MTRDYSGDVRLGYREDDECGMPRSSRMQTPPPGFSPAFADWYRQRCEESIRKQARLRREIKAQTLRRRLELFRDNRICLSFAEVAHIGRELLKLAEEETEAQRNEPIMPAQAAE